MKFVKKFRDRTADDTNRKYKNGSKGKSMKMLGVFSDDSTDLELSNFDDDFGDFESFDESDVKRN